MSLYGGKIGGVETSLTPDGKLSIVHPHTTRVTVNKPTAEQAFELLSAVDQAEKTDDVHTVGFKADGFSAQPVQAVVWAKTDGDTWRVSHEQKVVLLKYGQEYSVFAADWKGFEQLKSEVKRYLRKCIDGRGGARLGTGRKASAEPLTQINIKAPESVLAWLDKQPQKSKYIINLIRVDMEKNT